MGEAAGSCDYVNRDAGAPFWLFGVWTNSTGSVSQAAVTKAGFPRLRRKNDRKNGVSSMISTL
jgi:hypothetical protein